MNLPDPASDAGFETEAERFACFAARLAADLRCENVTVLDLRDLSQVTDYFVIGSGTSNRQLNAVISDLKDLARAEGQGVFRSEGSRADSGWAVVDFVDVVAHFLTADQRAYYDLEGLWGDAAHVNWRDRTTPGQFARLGSHSTVDRGSNQA